MSSLVTQFFSSTKVLIVVTVYRPNLEYLKEQLESIKGQTHSNFGCIVAVDGSVGNLREWFLTLPLDDRFTFVADGVQRGQYRLIDHLLDSYLIGHDFVAIVDQDDLWMPDRLGKQVQRLSLSSFSMVTDNALLASSIDTGNLKFLRPSLFDVLGIDELSAKFALLANFATGAGSLYRASCARMAVPFPETTSAGIHDHWLLLVSLLYGNCYLEQQTTWVYRQHEQNLIGVKKLLRKSTRLRAAILKLSEIIGYRLFSQSDPHIDWLIIVLKRLSSLTSRHHPLVRTFLTEIGSSDARRHLLNRRDLVRSRGEYLRVFLWRSIVLKSLNDTF